MQRRDFSSLILRQIIFIWSRIGILFLLPLVWHFSLLSQAKKQSKFLPKSQPFQVSNLGVPELKMRGEGQWFITTIMRSLLERAKYLRMLLGMVTWLHNLDSTWLLFGVCASLIAPLSPVPPFLDVFKAVLDFSSKKEKKMKKTFLPFNIINLKKKKEKRELTNYWLLDLKL